MDLNTITVADFKTQFSRDFAYLPVYVNTELYNTDDVVYYETTKLFYIALQDGIIGVVPGSDATKWQKTDGNVDDYILDQDITNAFAEAQILFNQGFFDTDAAIKLGYLYLTAHFVCNDFKAGQAGVSAIGSFPVTSRSAGSISESYGIPEAYLSNPAYAFLTNSAYGMKYFAMIWPNLIGNVISVCGRTHA